MEMPNDRKRARDEESDDSIEVKRLREDLLDLFDDHDADLSSAASDLDSVIRSFAEEIGSSSHSPPVEENANENQPDLGYLLEASDDELGLPPPPMERELANPDPATLLFDSSGIDEILQSDEGISNYEMLGFGFGEDDAGNGGFEPFDDLFDHSGLAIWTSEFSDVPRRPESLSAL